MHGSPDRVPERSGAGGTSSDPPLQLRGKRAERGKKKKRRAEDSARLFAPGPAVERSHFLLPT